MNAGVYEAVSYTSSQPIRTVKSRSGWKLIRLFSIEGPPETECQLRACGNPMIVAPHLLGFQPQGPELRNDGIMLAAQPVMPTASVSRITIEPDKRGGQPCIRRLRITVWDVLGWLGAGMSEKQILDEHPDLEMFRLSSRLSVCRGGAAGPTLFEPAFRRESFSKLILRFAFTGDRGTDSPQFHSDFRV